MDYSPTPTGGGESSGVAGLIKVDESFWEALKFQNLSSPLQGRGLFMN